MANTRIWDDGGLDTIWTTAANWSADTALVSTDTGIVPAFTSDAGSGIPDIVGVDDSAVLLAAVYIEPGCEFKIGTRILNLYIDTDLFVYEGNGLCYFKIDNCAEFQILNGTTGDTGIDSYGFHLDGTNASGVLNIDPGASNTVGVAAVGDTSAQFSSITVESGIVTIGRAVTNATAYLNGGTVEYGSDVTTMNMNNGTATITANNPTTLNMNGGRLYYNSTDAITTLNGRGGVLDFSQDGRAKDWTGATAMNIWPGFQIYDPNKVLAPMAFVPQKGGTWRL
jgi:hypothetical protein